MIEEQYQKTAKFQFVLETLTSLEEQMIGMGGRRSEAKTHMDDRNGFKPGFGREGTNVLKNMGFAFSRIDLDNKDVVFVIEEFVGQNSDQINIREFSYSFENIKELAADLQKRRFAGESGYALEWNSILLTYIDTALSGMPCQGAARYLMEHCPDIVPKFAIEKKKANNSPVIRIA